MNKCCTNNQVIDELGNCIQKREGKIVLVLY